MPNNTTKTLLVAAVVTALALTTGWSQSSGSFTATVSNTQCTINTTPGLPNSGQLSGGNPVHMLDTYIQTPNSKFTTLLITPSLVTGLFNNTEVTQAMDTSGNSAAVRVFVTLDGKAVAPDTGPVNAPNGIIYDQRFQQLSTNIFDQIATCSVNNNCSIDLVESTLAAHSFNFVAPNVGGGNHHLVVQWAFQCTDNAGLPTACTTAYTANTAGACAGPGSVTVTQVKNFSQDAPIVIGP
ncbi:MAG: hypothetical protein QOG67_3612 [Verrucomicrobiota bacterium]|jgi:hypothetical protein